MIRLLRAEYAGVRTEDLLATPRQRAARHGTLPRMLERETGPRQCGTSPELCSELAGQSSGRKPGE